MREQHGLAVDGHFPGRGIDADVLVFVDRFGTPGAAPQQCPDAGQQFVQVVWLDDVVVRAVVQPFHALRDRIACGRHQYGHTLLACPHAAQHFKPVLAGQAEIQQYQVVAFRSHGGFGGGTGTDPVDGVGFGPQKIQDRFADHQVIFNEQQAHGATLVHNEKVETSSVVSTLIFQSADAGLVIVLFVI